MMQAIDKQRFKQQSGVALLTAVLVVALAAIAATSIAANHQLSIRRTENAVFGSQTWSYLHGGESWTKLILARDLDDSDYDYTGEAWAVRLPPLPIPGGYISGVVIDEQGKFNINNLLSGSEPDALSRQRLERLFSLLELDPSLVQAIIDWIDPDVEATIPDGAEDDYYTRLDQPYLTANQPMHHISELRLIKGFDQEVYDTVIPYVTALPANTAINVNTADPILIAALSSQLSLSAAETIVNNRENEEGFESLQEFAASSIEGIEINFQALSVQSSYFKFDANVKIGNNFISASSILHRAGSDNINVISRTPIR